MWLSTPVLRLSDVEMYVSNESFIRGLVHKYWDYHMWECSSVVSLSYVA